MADKGKDVPPPGDEEDEGTPGYQAPAKVDLATLQELDADDPAMVRWKEQLLAGAEKGIDANDPRKVIVESMTVRVDGRDDLVFPMNTPADIAKLKETPFVLKENVIYRIMFTFRINADIVAGLKYMNLVYKKGIRVDKSTHMLGSYGPNKDAYTFTTPDEEVPSGMLARGRLTAKSKFIDDDKNVHLEFSYIFDIKKDWN